MPEIDSYPLFSGAQIAPLRALITAGDLPADGFFATSLAQLQARVDPELKAKLDVPGHGEAGSYAHNRHRDNAHTIEAAGRLYQMTGNRDYARLATEILGLYAERYPAMPYQQQKNTNPPGRLFHQILNEHMWLLYAVLGYSHVRETLPETQRQAIENNIFHPMIEMFTVTYRHDFDRIHNHGLWAVAAVGICALVLGEDKVLDQAIFGLEGDSISGGYLAQIKRLFAPSGYYIEGPYYHRFAIRPLCLFAEALHLHRPELDIYGFHDQAIGKTIRALLMTSYPNGRFPALNDASLSMDIKDEGVVIAVAVHHARYGHCDALVGTARQQGQVWLYPCAFKLAQAVDAAPSEQEQRPYWPSVELNEGMQGDRGAQGFLRQRQHGDITQAVMNYGQHGMGHGHFDTLGLTLFSHDQEVLREYGFGRWVNVETKFGGRYLDENKSWARQTVAHNTVVLDQGCQNAFDVALADSHHGERHFFSGTGPVQAMSAFANQHYAGVGMQRTVLLIELDALSSPLLIDLFRLSSEQTHQYDYPVHYQGQITHSNIDFQPTERRVLGTDNGYQHLFDLARGPTPQCLSLTWLQDNCFHTWLAAAEGAELILAQTGANDPSFNLRRQDCLLLRQHGRDQLFASLFETHGQFDEASEHCEGARGAMQHIDILGHNDQGSVVAIRGEAAGAPFHMTLMISNRADVCPTTEHRLFFNNTEYHWQGYFAVVTNKE